MMILITGGSKCGKSSVAEGLLNGFPGEKYYIAAMEPYGEDAQRAIARAPGNAPRQGIPDD